MSVKIAIVGAGNLGFTCKLVHDILAVPELRGITVALTDTHKRNLSAVTQVLKRDIATNGLPTTLESTTDRKAALAGAHYVATAASLGGLVASQLDSDIARTFGVDPCVGDTLGADGIMRGQRGIATMLDLCREIREMAEPNALLLNYATPNAMLTWAANEYGEVDCVGLCHGVQDGHRQLTTAIELLVNGKKMPGDKGYRAIDLREVDILCAGIQPQTWFTQVLFEGEDWTDKLLTGFETHPTFCETEKAQIDILRRFGYYSTKLVGHLPETADPKLPAGVPWQLAGHTRSLEHGSYLIESLETGRIYRGHLNVPNCQRTITNLPEDAVVEVPCYVDRNGINVPSVGELPPGCAAVCASSAGIQRLAVLAAVGGDVTLLKQAMMLAPLVGEACTELEISRMTDELLVAQARWLPQFAHAIADAKKRLKRAKPAKARQHKG